MEKKTENPIGNFISCERCHIVILKDEGNRRYCTECATFLRLKRSRDCIARQRILYPHKQKERNEKQRLRINADPVAKEKHRLMKERWLDAPNPDNPNETNREKMNRRARERYAEKKKKEKSEGGEKE